MHGIIARAVCLAFFYIMGVGGYVLYVLLLYHGGGWVRPVCVTYNACSCFYELIIAYNISSDRVDVWTILCYTREKM